MSIKNLVQAMEGIDDICNSAPNQANETFILYH